jgi:hypothetical protein
MSIGETYVRLTKVVTVPTGTGSNEHNTFPNWVYNGAHAAKVDLRIEAEAGEDVFTAATPYQLYIGVACLDNPAALNAIIGSGGLFPLLPGAIAAENVDAAHGWVLDAREGSYKKTWIYTLPTVATGFNFGVHDTHTYQYIVSLIDTAASKKIASTMLSEPFCVI